MKWTNPEHQLDEIGLKYIGIKYIYLFGTDNDSEDMYNFLIWLGMDKDIKIYFVWDETEHEDEFVPNEFCGRKVIRYNNNSNATDIVEDINQSVVVLKKYGHTRRRDLLINKGIENIFYMIPEHNGRKNFVQNFVCIYMMYKYGKLVSHWTNYLLTSKCNLNCKYCLNYTEFIDNQRDVSFEDFKMHFDVLFSKFDYLYSLHFAGGEPLLTRELEKKLQYIIDNYGNRFYDFFIVTNGTIVPSDNILELIKEMNGWLFIDDYSDTVNLTKIDEICDKLNDKGIKYGIAKAPYWYNLDIDATHYDSYKEEELEFHKDDCHSYLHEFGEGNIYACCYQQYASRVGKVETTSDDYIQIAESTKMEILEFRQGYSKKGYTSLCKRCRGMGKDAFKVKPAVQIMRR